MEMTFYPTLDCYRSDMISFIEMLIDYEVDFSRDAMTGEIKVTTHRDGKIEQIVEEIKSQDLPFSTTESEDDLLDFDY